MSNTKSLSDVSEESQYNIEGLDDLIRHHRTPLTALGLVIVLGILFNMFTFEVPAGNSAFLNTMGKVAFDTRYEPGLHLKFPLAQSVQLYPTRTVAEAHTSQPRDKTNQVLTADWSVELMINPAYSGQLLKEIGTYDGLKQKVIDPFIATSAQAETPTYSPEDLVKLRPQLVANIKKRLQDAIDARLKEYKIPENAVRVIQIACMNFKFSDPFEASIEQKVEQEQKRQTAEITKQIDTIQADADGQEKEILGKANAKRTQLLGDANAYAIDVKGQAAKLNTLLAPWVQLQKWDGEPSNADLASGASVIITNPAQSAEATHN
jgi:regulator of protease activity HflC (stomatin/prohibitin superfamily)